MDSSILNSLSISLIDIVLIAIISYVAIIWLRKPLDEFLNEMITDSKIKQMVFTFILWLLILEAVKAGLNFIIQPELREILGGITSLAAGIANVIQWVVYISVLFFIGYSAKALQSASIKTIHFVNPASPASVVNPQPTVPVSPPSQTVPPPLNTHQVSDSGNKNDDDVGNYFPKE